MKTLIYYLIVINIITFFFYGLDKRRAIKNAWRIPEATLIGLAALGGGLGAFLGMHLFHHKTRKLKFKTPVPIFIIIWVIVTFLNYF